MKEGKGWGRAGIVTFLTPRHVGSSLPLMWLVQDLFLSADDMQEPQGEEKEAPQVLFLGESVAPSFTGSVEVGKRMGSHQESDSWRRRDMRRSVSLAPQAPFPLQQLLLPTQHSLATSTASSLLGLSLYPSLLLLFFLLLFLLPCVWL